MIIGISGCAETTEISGGITPWGTLTSQMDIYRSEFAEAQSSYSDAVYEYETASSKYYNSVDDYNFKKANDFETSPMAESTIEENKRNLSDATQNLIIKCKIAESQIDVIFAFMEENKELWMDVDAEDYISTQSFYLERKVTIEAERKLAEETLNL